MEGEEHTSNHGHIQRPSLPQYIVHPTEYPLVQNETTLLAEPLKAIKVESPAPLYHC